MTMCDTDIFCSVSDQRMERERLATYTHVRAHTCKTQPLLVQPLPSSSIKCGGGVDASINAILHGDMHFADFPMMTCVQKSAAIYSLGTRCEHSARYESLFSMGVPIGCKQIGSTFRMRCLSWLRYSWTDAHHGVLPW